VHGTICFVKSFLDFSVVHQSIVVNCIAYGFHSKQTSFSSCFDMKLVTGLVASVVLLCSQVRAYETDDYVMMPNGVGVHRECVHFHDIPFHVDHLGDQGEVVLEDGKSPHHNRPCPHPLLRKEGLEKNQRVNGADSYYSGWVVYAEALANKVGSDDGESYSGMNSTWKVPPAPKSKGPLGLSSIYIFNGLEDGGGHHNASLILQPVLSYGKSGCVLNPLHWGEWSFLSFLVSGSGRAHCGQRIPVKEGDVLQGSMQNLGGNKWQVTSLVPASNQKSVYTSQLGADVSINAAYLTLEAMIIYSCAAFPGGKTTFYQNSLCKGPNSCKQSSFGWVKWLKHTECNQNVEIDSASGDVAIIY
jgi:hypothetical protein